VEMDQEGRGFVAHIIIHSFITQIELPSLATVGGFCPELMDQHSSLIMWINAFFFSFIVKSM